MKILITSLEDKLANTLTSYLLLKGCSVSAMVKSGLDRKPPPITSVLCDIEDYEPTSEAISKCDVVIHMSMNSFLKYSPEAIGKGYEREILGAINVFNGCRTHRKVVVYVNLLERNEDVFGKLAAQAVERLSLMYKKEHGLKIASVREMDANFDDNYFFEGTAPPTELRDEFQEVGDCLIGAEKIIVELIFNAQTDLWIKESTLISDNLSSEPSSSDLQEKLASITTNTLSPKIHSVSFNHNIQGVA